MNSFNYKQTKTCSEAAEEGCTSKGLEAAIAQLGMKHSASTIKNDKSMSTHIGICTKELAPSLTGVIQ